MGSETAHPDSDVISPELVLVSSPEDAQRARELLPEGPSFPPPERALRPPQRHLHAVVDDPLQQQQQQQQQQPPRRRHLPVRAIAVPVAAALAASGYLTARHSLGGPASIVSVVVSTTSPVIAPPVASTAPQRHPTPAPLTDTAGRARTTTPAPTTTPATSTATLAPGEFIPSRTWSWGPQPGATAYDVTFYRDGNVVLHARPKQNRLVLPLAFQFRAGSYRWTVRRVPPVAGHRPIADSTFSLTPAAAAAANGRLILRGARCGHGLGRKLLRCGRQ